jgi:hypothetical protein
MKNLDLLKRASEDPAYRRAMLRDAQKSKNFAIAFIWICLLLGVTTALFAMFGKMRWSVAAISFLPATVALLQYNILCSLVAKLDAMSLGPNHSTEPSPTSDASAAEHPPRQP